MDEESHTAVDMGPQQRLPFFYAGSRGAKEKIGVKGRLRAASSVSCQTDSLAI